MKKIALVILLGLPSLFLMYTWHIGAWNLLFPKAEYDTVGPSFSGVINRPAILVFSKTNQFRHKASIQSGVPFFTSLADQRGWGVFATENGAVFSSQFLSKFDVVIFLNVTGDVLSGEQEEAFKSWYLNGGGWLGVHAAGDGSHTEWGWYMEHLVGADFIAHTMGPQFQKARVVNEMSEHPVMVGLPTDWTHVEEWYSWDINPEDKGFLIFASVDEATYSPREKVFFRDRDLSMGEHPVVWGKCLGAGKSVYVALGHQAEAYDSKHLVKLLGNSIDWIIADPPSTAGCS